MNSKNNQFGLGFSHKHDYLDLNSHISARSPQLLLRAAGALGVGCAIVAVAGAFTVRADTTFDEIGLTQLQQTAPMLTGSGVAVAQVEASESSTSFNVFEPNISSCGATVPSVTYFDAYGNSSGTYNPSYGSGHATYVGSLFYGAGGVSPGISQLYVYAEYGYYSNLYYDSTPVNESIGTAPSVVNQSFMYPGVPSSTAKQLDGVWDNYAAQYNILYVTAIGDGQTTATSPASYINPPADSYNGIAVGAYTGTETNGVLSPSTGSEASWVGPTWDGRSKPDITAPGAYTSYTAPIVSGVATLLIQAGRQGDSSSAGGTPTGYIGSYDGTTQTTTQYTAAATDIRTVKALLLNGASKPTGWTNSYTVNNGTYTYNPATTTATTPLDPRYGAGVVNAYNSYENLAGGEHGYTTISEQRTTSNAPAVSISTTSVETASATNPSTITGWNLSSISSSATSNAIEHYDFSLPGTVSVNSWDLTATLTWNKDYNASGINHLLLFLLNSGGNVVASSTSMLDNVQQININPALGINSIAPGQYDLAVEMLGGQASGIPTTDTYALAWNFVDPTAVPEPAAFALFFIGAGTLLLQRRNLMHRKRAICASLSR